MKICTFVLLTFITKSAAQDDVAKDEILSRRGRIDEVNEDYDAKAREVEELNYDEVQINNADSENDPTPVNNELDTLEKANEADEQLRIQQEHLRLHQQIHEQALANAGQDSATASHTETVHTVHTEVKETATDEVLSNKIQITKTETNEDGTVSEQHFEATIERVDPDGSLITGDDVPTDVSSNEQVDSNEHVDSQEPIEALIDETLDESGEEKPASMMENAINVQRNIIYQKQKEEKGKIRVLKEIDLNGVKLWTSQEVVDESDPNVNLVDHDEFEEWDEQYVKQQLQLRYNQKRRIDVTSTQFVSIDHLRPKLLPADPPLGFFENPLELEEDSQQEEVKKTEFSLKCVTPWILNGEAIMDKCVTKLRTDRRPWCSLDEVFQGNFEFCPETPEERLERQTILEREQLMREGLELISGWDSRRSVIKSGYEKLDEAYGLGHMNCTGMVAWAKLLGFFMPLNVKEARSLAEDGALRGRSMDQGVLGFMHAVGVGFKADQAKALLYWSFAAAGGSQTAHMVLGFRYSKGIGVKVNCEKALHHYQTVASRVTAVLSFSGGTAKAKLPLEYLREQTLDDSGLHDVNLINYYELLVTQGETNAMLQLSQLLIDRGYEPDYRRAAELLKKSAAEHPVAAARLGRLYLDGRGVPQDNRLAFDWLKQAADKNNPMGLTYLGVMYELAIHSPVAKVPKYLDAFQLYVKAADAGFAEAQYRLGMCYYNGYGTKQDIRLAVKYLQLASQHQNIRAIMQLADLQSSGRGIPRSCQGAVDMYKNVAERGMYSRLFMQAAQQYKQEKYQSAYIIYSILSELGFSVAQQNVAQLLEEVDITITGEENLYPRALMNFNRAADQGLSSSRVKVGDYSYYGLGTSQDMLRAGQHYRTAAEEGGSSQAFFNLGWMHQHGLGLDKDKYLAKRYYDQAIEVNPTEATLPSTLAILYLQAEEFLGFAGKHAGSITISDVNGKIEKLVFQYVGVNWDIYFGLFLLCILVFVIAFRRQ